MLPTPVALSGILLGFGLHGSAAFPLGLSTHGPSAGPRGGPDYLLAVADVVLLLAVVWTIFSAIEYPRGAWGILTDPTPREST